MGYTDKWHYTIIDAPGHRDFIKNMISGAAQADVALLMVPSDGNFITAIQRGNHKAGEVQGQTRQHGRLINLLGVKQLIVGVNKIGWKKDFVAKSVPVMPISGWCGDNLLKKSDNMPWWKGMDIECQLQKGGTETLHIDTMLQALND